MISNNVKMYNVGVFFDSVFFRGGFVLFLDKWFNFRGF